MVGEMSVTEEEEGGVSEVQAHIGDWGGRWSNSCEQKFVLIVVVADKEIFYICGLTTDVWRLFSWENSQEVTKLTAWISLE